MLITKHKDLEFRRFYKDPEERKGMGDVTNTECKFVRWIPRTKTNADYHLVCLVHHYTNGEAVKELKFIKDYPRPFWVTRKIHQTYKDKKEFEHVSRLDKVLTTQSDLDESVCRALGKPVNAFNIATLKNSPYLYGYEIPSSSYIKHFYNVTNNNFISDYHVVNFDIEFDVTGKYNDVSIITLSLNGVSHIAALRRLYKDITTDDDEIKRKLREMIDKDLPDSEAKRNCKYFNISLHDNDLDLLKTVFAILHKMKPDFVTIHNLGYDIPRIIERCKHWEYSIEDLFSDPSIPKQLRRFTFKQARDHKVKKGVMYNLPFEERWSTVDITASFMIMDSMTGFAAIRQAAGKVVGGYSLENLLLVHGLDGKLKYEDEHTKSLTKLQWHQYMSEEKPFEYSIYGIQDTMGMTNLENKVKDFTTTISIFAGITDYLRFNSSTHKAICNAYVENRHKGLVVGTTPKDAVDRSYLGTDGWIKTLSSNHIQAIGLKCTNIPSLRTNITNSGIDLDCVSSYPNGIQAGNVSIATARAEILKIGDVPLEVLKANNIDIISSGANSASYGRNMLNYPGTMSLLKDIRHMLKNEDKAS